MNPKLKDRYFKNVEEKKSRRKNSTRTELLYSARYTKAREYVKDATFNDEEEYTDSLPEEILEHLREEVSRPLEAVIASKESVLANKEEILAKHEKRRREGQMARIDRLAKRFARIWSIVLGFFAINPSVYCTANCGFCPRSFLEVIFSMCFSSCGVLVGIDGYSRDCFWAKNSLNSERSTCLSSGISSNSASEIITFTFHYYL